MSTRSNIGIEHEDGSIDFVYCHSDGYLDYNGKMLFHNYQTAKLVKELVALGDISSLDSSPSSTRDYHSWRGETVEISHTNSRDETYQQEYSYIFSEVDDTWYAKGHGFDWMTLSDALDEHS